MDLDLHSLETSFDLIAPRGEELMDELYARLFDAAPAVITALRRDRLAAPEGDAAEHSGTAA